MSTRLLVALSLLACGPEFAAESAAPTDSKAQKAPAGAEVRPRTLDWEELLPEERRAGHASVPPLPAPLNHVVFVHVQTPFALGSVSAAMWVTSRLSTQSKVARLGAAACTLAPTSLEEYRY